MRNILIVIGLVIAIVFYVQYRKLRNYRDTAQVQAVELAALKDDISVLEKENGELAFQFKSSEIEKRNIKESLEIMGIEKEDLKQQNIRYKKLISVLRLEIESFGSGQTTVVDTFKVIVNKEVRDTIRYQKINDYTDPYLKLFNAEIINGTFDFEYQQNVYVDLFHHRKKNSIIVTANLKNPNSSVVSGQSLTISTKKKWYEKQWLWGLVGLGTGYYLGNK